MRLWPCALVALLLGVAPVTVIAAPVSVRITQGVLTGSSDGTIEIFKGIPYAQPPIGPLRWKPPLEALPWTSKRDASDFGPSCPQPGPPESIFPGSPASRRSEDCLTLNIWAPAGADHLRPVMVWLHGGGDQTGSSADHFYDGTSFARDGIVLVSLNYRLGLLGFFAHPSLVEEAKPGDDIVNFGLMDQVAALRFVQRNIAAFGGDPHNVTLFGESAGGLDAIALMTAPSARGLFAKAIVESAGFWANLTSLAVAEKQGAEVATQLGLPGARASAAQLRALPAERLVQVPDADLPGPVVDGRFLPEAPVTAIADGHALDIPLIVGTNDDEGSLLGRGPASPSDVASDLTKDDLAALREDYGAAASGDDTFARLLFRDRYFAAPARWLAERQTARAPVFLYRFGYVLGRLRALRTGAGHGSEIPFVFASVSPDAGLLPADDAEIGAVHGCWVAFAKTGTPVCPSTPPWPIYVSPRDTMLFGDQNSVGAAPERSALRRLLIHDF